jgi:hypothetical protein
MPTYLLKQPDGKIAIFSSEVDDFTYYGLSEEEAVEVGVEEWGRRTALEKLRNAIEDKRLMQRDFVSDGLGRWRESLENVAFRHGLVHLRTILAEIGFPEWPIHEKALRKAADMEAMRAEGGLADEPSGFE